MYKGKWCYYTWHTPTGLFLCFKSSFPRKGMQTQNNTKITHVYWQKTYLVKEVWVIRLDVGFRCLFPDKLGASDAPIIPTGVINQIKYVTHNSVNFHCHWKQNTCSSSLKHCQFFWRTTYSVYIPWSITTNKSMTCVPVIWRRDRDFIFCRMKDSLILLILLSPAVEYTNSLI